MVNRLFVLISLVILLCSCSVRTSPNTSVIYKVPSLRTEVGQPPTKSTSYSAEPLSKEVQSLFELLYAVDALLAQEVGKLPEFQNKLTASEVRALRRFVNLAANSTPLKRVNLAKLLQEGRPEVRKYCSPLQAIFWILEKDENREENPLIWPLDRILNEAWMGTGFELGAPNRWKNFEEVTSRLNSPVLVDYYGRMNFTYQSMPYDDHPSPRYIFGHRVGTHVYHAAFYIYCLEKAGYSAKPIVVKKSLGSKTYCIVEFEDKDGQNYIICNTTRPPGYTGGSGIHEKASYLKYQLRLH